MKKLFIAIGTVLLAACATENKPAAPELFEAAAFQTEIGGKQTSLYTLTNANGMAVQLTNYGARIVDLWVPAKDGSFKDVVMGFENIEGYLKAKDINNGPVVGRYGNRIGKGRFTLDGTEYQLTINEGENHLHGGTGGFSSRVWDAVQEGNSVAFSYLSPDGEDGYPGNMNIKAVYTLTDDNQLVITYEATTDAPTILNPTSHSYFNLHGTNDLSTNSHVLTIYADSFTPTDAALIPTGEIATVEGTPLDFRTATAVGERIESDFEAIKLGGGYDHNWILTKGNADKDVKTVELAAEAYEPSTGIVMKVLTDQPAIQFYSGNFMDGSDAGKRGNVNNYRSGIALETQNYPDAPNHENFPSAVLRPGETYTQTCVYKFEVKN